MVAEGVPQNGAGALIVTDKVTATQSHKAIGVTVASTTKAIGIIQPPPDIRSIVEKTAAFVAKSENGAEFERRILANEKSNAKFNFLNANDPYHAFYRHRIKEIQEGSGQVAEEPVEDEKKEEVAKAEAKQAELVEPDAQLFTIPVSDGIAAIDLDVIKLTAQYVARNGKGFLSGLTSREHMNPQFSFLKPTHSLFSFFTALADTYSRVLMPPKEVTERIEKTYIGKDTMLEKCLNRMEWEKAEETKKQQMEDDLEKEREAMASIDWHDFVVVETIEFADDEDDDLPPPMTLEELKLDTRQDALDMGGPVQGDGAQMDMEVDATERDMIAEGQTANESRPYVPPPDPEMKIVKHYKRPEERLTAQGTEATQFVISPFTGEKVHVSDMAEHMRISLIDPRWKEQKEAMLAKIKDTIKADDSEIVKNVVTLAKTRPDIFGTTEEELQNAVVQEMQKPQEIPSSAPSGTRLEEQIAAVHQQKANEAALPRMPTKLPSSQPLPPPAMGGPPPMIPGPPVMIPPGMPPQGMSPLPGMMPGMPGIPPSGPFMGGPPGMAPLPVPQMPLPVVPAPESTTPAMPPPPPTVEVPGGGTTRPAPEESEAPEAKKAKTEIGDTGLEPESEFAAANPGPVTLSVLVQLPNSPKDGQTLEVTLPSVSATVNDLKAHMAAEVGVPEKKQKINLHPVGFLKDHLTLAYYNVGPTSSLTLGLKERGGRKR